MSEEEVNRVLAGLSHTGYTTELERCEAQLLIKELNKENRKLKRQLDYLRSGEYYNQLRFERNMLQDVVDKMEVSKEDKEFIDCTHRNTELLEENQNLKELNKALSKGLKKVVAKRKKWKSRYETEHRRKQELLREQKEFIKWLESEISSFDFLDRELLLSNNKKEIKVCKEVLSKFKEITGVKE